MPRLVRSGGREQGLQPVKLSLHDTRSPGFAEECRRQAVIIAAADRADQDSMEFLDAAAADLSAILE